MLYFVHDNVVAKATKVGVSPYRLRGLDHVPFTDADPDRRRVGTPKLIRG